MKSKNLSFKILSFVIALIMLFVFTACNNNGVSMEEYNKLVDEMGKIKEELNNAQNGTNIEIPDSADENFKDELKVNKNPPPEDLDENPVEEFEYKYNADFEGVEITNYLGTSIKVRIPEYIENVPVKIIEGSIFYNNGIMYVYLPNTLEIIGNQVFRDCTELTSIIIPDNVTIIGNSAFKGCTNLKNIEIPASAMIIGASAFENNTGLTNIVINEGLTEIGPSAFNGCTSLINIEIPASVMIIGISAFENNTELTNIVINEGVTEIAPSAFNGCMSLINIEIPASVMIVGTSAFKNNTELTNIVINEGITNIGDGAFSRCKNLKNITIPNSVTNIGTFAFSDCTSLTNVIIGNNVENIGESAFDGCANLASITIPDSAKEIGSFAFKNCKGLTRVIIGNNVENIGESAFSGCTGLTSVKIPENVKIEINAFIGTNVFSETNMFTYWFTGCENLKEVIMGKNLTKVIMGHLTEVMGNQMKTNCVIFFGGYFWRILAIKNERALIISEDILLERAYHIKYEDITWEECELRQYLNEQFYNETFSADEKKRIIETMVVNNDNPDYGTYGGNDTYDKIFLLSIEEAKKYVDNDVYLLTKTGWWLRSPGNYSNFAACTDYGSHVNSGGGFVKSDYDCGVRPVLWLDL